MKEAKKKLQQIIKEELFYRDFYRAGELLAFRDALDEIEELENKENKDSED